MPLKRLVTLRLEEEDFNRFSVHIYWSLHEHIPVCNRVNCIKHARTDIVVSSCDSIHNQPPIYILWSSCTPLHFKSIMR